MREYDTIAGRVFTRGIALVTLVILFYSLFFSVGGTKPFGLFNRVYFFGFDMHRYTVFVMFSSFLFHWWKTRFLLPLLRFIVSATITTWYVYFHHLLWNISSYIFRGIIQLWVPLLGTVFLSLLLYTLNIKRGIFKILFKDRDLFLFTCLLVLQVIGLIGMAYTGFWGALTLSDLGVGPDPNINFWWLVWKGSSFWVLYPLIFDTNLRAPLMMDPRVF